MIFSDTLYGRIELPGWLSPFVTLPEFVRLRGVRLSNVDSFEHKDFTGPARWEHSLGVAYLASVCAKARGLNQNDTAHLVIGALLHDVATPPFGHTVEYVLPDFDHELESVRLLGELSLGDAVPNTPIFASQLPQFGAACETVRRKFGIKVDQSSIASSIVGGGPLGFLIKGTLDLDNSDNVIRAGHYLGISVDRGLPLQLAKWLASLNGAPLDLATSTEPIVQQWLKFRTALYSSFFNASDEELGREAYLQFLMRRALRAGYPRANLIWNTDERLLFDFETFSETPVTLQGRTSLSELVLRYRLLESPTLVARVDIHDENLLWAAKNPEFCDWLEGQFDVPEIDYFTAVSKRRYTSQIGSDDLFPPPEGSILLYKLGGMPKLAQLPTWLQRHIRAGNSTSSLQNEVRRRLEMLVPTWLQDKPWKNQSHERNERVVSRLRHVQNWGFRLSKNSNLYPYPGTFVFAIPATLINTLGVRSETILDPFGGTGQTAIEAIKQGCRVVSADSNYFALLTTRVSTTYLEAKIRAELYALTSDTVESAKESKPPEIDSIEKWYHEKTLKELCQIHGMISRVRRPNLKQFLELCFSAIQPFCTGRRGKQHGFFADNTPLPTGSNRPPYQPAIQLFLDRVRSNLGTIENLYAFLERDNRDPRTELDRATVVEVDASGAESSSYLLQPGSVAAVITSPPYLCMADYSLGQRLSYYWLCPERLEHDYAREIGARRRRSQPEQAYEAYMNSLAVFARNMSELVRDGGYLATVLGAPVAKSYENAEIHQAYDRLLEQHGFKEIWSTWRDIHWHRQHGYSRLKRERISVHMLQTG